MVPYDSFNSPQLLDKLILRAVRCPCVSRTILIKSQCFSTIEVVSSGITFLLHPQFQSEPSGKDSQHNIYPISVKTVRTDARSSLSGFIIAVDEVHCRIVLFVSITGPEVEDLWFVIALSDGDASVTGITDDLCTWGLQSRSDD